MRKTRSGKPKLSAIYRAAGETLALDGRRLILIESIVVGLLLVSVYVMLYQAFSMLGILLPPTLTGIVLFYTVYYLLVCALTIFVTLPLFLGVWRMAGKMERGETPVLAETFYYFSDSVCYRRALSLSFGGFWRMLCVVLAAMTTCGTTEFFFPEEPLAGLLCGVAVILEIALWLLLVLRRFATFAVALQDEVTVKDARRIAKEIGMRTHCGGLRFFLAYLPRVLLGILTLGVYLLWDVLPCMGVAYFSYCKQMNDMIIRSEE